MSGSRRRFCLAVFIMIVFSFLFLTAGSALAASRIKDIAQISGARKNQLVGYGIVVGLNGTGDQKTAATPQAMSNMLQALGLNIPAALLRVKNVASVLVTADLPAFADSGSLLDVTVSSLGDATSLQGGLLVMTPLTAGNGEVYAVAQGTVVMGSGSATGRNSHLTVGRIPNGATIEREVSSNFIDPETNSFDIALTNPDFTTSFNIARAINRQMGAAVAQPLSAGTVRVSVQPDWNDLVRVCSEIELIEVPVDIAARVIVNEKTGSVVMGGNVRVLPVAIAYANLSISINTSGQKNTGGSRAANSNATAERVAVLEQESTVSDLVKLLNTLGAAPKDIVGILTSLKDSGALLAELEAI